MERDLKRQLEQLKMRARFTKPYRNSLSLYMQESSVTNVGEAPSSQFGATPLVSPTLVNKTKQILAVRNPSIGPFTKMSPGTSVPVSKMTQNYHGGSEIKTPAEGYR